MARTYSEILDETFFALNLQGDQSRAFTKLNDAFRFFWDVLPWKETLGDMDPFYLVEGYSVYVTPLIDLADDFRDVYSAELMTLSSNGAVDWRDIKAIGNMKPGQSRGGVNSVGYNPEFHAILLDSVPNQSVGREYISIVYKRDYPYVLTSEVASETDFPFERNEGIFKSILGWYLRGSQEAEYPMVGRAIYMAKLAESPGKQAETLKPEGLFSQLGV